MVGGGSRRPKKHASTLVDPIEDQGQDHDGFNLYEYIACEAPEALLEHPIVYQFTDGWQSHSAARE